VGRKLTETCRDMDLPCRYGGEEFAIVMPATLLADAKIAAERIRTAVENMPVNFEGKELRVTTSVGLAQLSGQDDIPRLVRRADAALYASKNAGRNCGHWHDGDESHPFTERILKAQQVDRARQAKNQPAPLLDSLPNRTKFADELRRRIAESTRTDQPIAVLVVELGNHELVKSQFGGHSSYRALDTVAKALQESLRDMDLLARLSESRFAIMLPENTVIPPRWSPAGRRKHSSSEHLPSVTNPFRCSCGLEGRNTAQATPSKSSSAAPKPTCSNRATSMHRPPCQNSLANNQGLLLDCE
jgi:diguanylate cyclase